MMGVGGLEDDGFATSAAYAGADHSQAARGEKQLGQGAGLAEVCRHLEITEATWYRWRNQYGGMKSEDAKRLRELERENARLKKMVAEQALDIDMLKELGRGNW
jgi:putative transposase